MKNDYNAPEVNVIFLGISEGLMDVEPGTESCVD